MLKSINPLQQIKLFVFSEVLTDNYYELHLDINNQPQLYLNIHRDVHQAYAFAVNYKSSSGRHKSTLVANVFQPERKPSHNQRNFSHKSNKSTSEEEKTQSKPSTPQEKGRRDGQYCKYHKTTSHSTESCYKLKRLSEAKEVSVAHVENSEADFSNDHVSHIFMVEERPRSHSIGYRRPGVSIYE
jgi:hypothetical protein